MKKRLLRTFNVYFRTHLLRTRHAMRNTQEELARKLCIEPRSYTALECGEHGCGALTLVLYLLYVCPDPAAFLAGLKAEFDKLYHDSAA